MIAAAASTPTRHAAAIVTDTHVFRGDARLTAIFAANLKPEDGCRRISAFKRPFRVNQSTYVSDVPRPRRGGGALVSAHMTTSICAKSCIGDRLRPVDRRRSDNEDRWHNACTRASHAHTIRPSGADPGDGVDSRP